MKKSQHIFGFINKTLGVRLNFARRAANSVCVLGGLGPCSGGGGGGGCSSKLPMAATIPTESAHHGGTSTS